MAAVLVRLCGAARAPSLRPWAALSTGTRRLCVQLRSGSSSLGTATGRLCVQLRGAALGSLWLFFVVRLWAASCTSLWVSLGGFAQHLCAASWYFFVGQLGRLAQHFQYYFVVLYGTRDRAETGGSSSSSVTLLRCSIPSALLLRIPQTEIFHTANLPGCHSKKRKTATANVFWFSRPTLKPTCFCLQAQVLFLATIRDDFGLRHIRYLYIRLTSIITTVLGLASPQRKPSLNPYICFAGLAWYSSWLCSEYMVSGRRCRLLQQLSRAAACLPRYFGLAVLRRQ